MKIQQLLYAREAHLLTLGSFRAFFLELIMGSAERYGTPTAILFIQ